MSIAVGPGDGRPAEQRWLVHLGLLVTFAAALGSFALLSGSMTVHVALGLAFAALVAVHLGQRRRTTARLARQLARLRSLVRPAGRLALADIVLGLLVVNVVVSGTVDLVRGRKTSLPVEALTGLHVPFLGWHAFSVVLLLGDLAVHVGRRRRRLRASTVR